MKIEQSKTKKIPKMQIEIFGHQKNWSDLFPEKLWVQRKFRAEGKNLKKKLENKKNVENCKKKMYKCIKS